MARILVVDDDALTVDLVSRMLGKGGHSPIFERDPRRVLKRIAEEDPDLLILDVMMPGMSGHELCERIRATEGLSQLPILMLTARAQAVDREAALSSGANDYLSKPVTQDRLIEHVNGLLDAQAPSVSYGEATVISLFSLRGGVGRTTVAANLAAALRRLTMKEVCLVDLSLSGGQVGLHLRLRPQQSWLDIPVRSDLNWSTVSEYLINHSSGLSILAAPFEPPAPVKPAGILAAEVILCLKQQFSYVVVDLPAVLTPAAITVLKQSDVVMQIVAPEPVSLKLAQISSQTLAKLGLRRPDIAYVLNNTNRQPQLSSTLIEKELRSSLAFTIDYDSNQDRALIHGVPLALTTATSPLATVSRRMAKQLSEHQIPDLIPAVRAGQTVIA